MSIQSTARTLGKRVLILLAALLVIVVFPFAALWDAADAFIGTYTYYSAGWYTTGFFPKVALSAESFWDAVVDDWWTLRYFLRFDVPAAWARA